MRKALSLFLIFSVALTAHAQRYKDVLFTKIDSAVDIPYGEALNIKNLQEKLMLDVFMPSNDTATKRPVLIFFHGGGFQNGNRKLGIGQTICKQFASRGYVTVSVSYRLGIDKAKTDQD